MDLNITADMSTSLLTLPTCYDQKVGLELNVKRIPAIPINYGCNEERSVDVD